MPAALAASFPLDTSLRVSVIHEQTYPDSHSYKVTAEDGAFYIMKVFPAAVARMLSFREVFANELGTLLGFSMAHWQLLQVDDQTRHEYLGRNDDADPKRKVLSGGLCFGTRVAEGPGCLREYLGEALIRANPEVMRQLGCIRIFDVWLAHAGFRRFAAVVEKRYPVYVYFFEHSQVLSPENPTVFAHRLDAAYKEARDIVGGSRPVNEFFCAIRKLTEGDLRKAIRAVPGIWRDPAWETKAVLMLQSRRDRLIALWRAGFAAPLESFPPTSLLCDTARVNTARVAARSV